MTLARITTRGCKFSETWTLSETGMNAAAVGFILLIAYVGPSLSYDFMTLYKEDLRLFKHASEDKELCYDPSQLPID